MNKLFIILSIVLFSCTKAEDPISLQERLKEANNITTWVETQAGHDAWIKDHPGDEQYFLHITSTNNEQIYGDYEEGLASCREKILGLPVTEKYGFAVMKKLGSGQRAGACYLYIEPQCQFPDSIEIINQKILEIQAEWSLENFSTVQDTLYNPDTKKYMSTSTKLQ